MRDNYRQADDKQHVGILTSGLADNQGSLHQSSINADFDTTSRLPAPIWTWVGEIIVSGNGTTHLLVLFPQFALFRTFFRNLFPWQPPLVGISVRALWLWRVTGARGVTSFPPRQSQSIPASSIMQVSNHPSWSPQTPRWRPTNVGFFLGLVSKGAGEWRTKRRENRIRCRVPTDHFFRQRFASK